MFRTNDRPLPRDYDGPICLWDIDNTYLMTEWSSVRDLLRIRFFEGAMDKRPVSGAPELLQALRRGATPAGERRPIYFVSASPETMRPVLEKRMLLDGVEQDGATFRDLWTHGLGMPHLRHLRDVYGYKIAALLLSILPEQNEYVRTELCRAALQLIDTANVGHEVIDWCLVSGRLSHT